MYKINSQSFYGINPTRVYDLPCLDNRKSFYGKAKIVETENKTFLQSYNTIVCSYSRNGEFTKMWDGYSVTTMRHINSFLAFIGLARFGGKSFWNELTTNTTYTF